MKKSKWIIDAIALAALLLVFMPDLTGLTIHEWLGIAIAGVLLIHFLQHWNWVISTSQRISQLKGKVLSRYLVDGGLALGFITITVTGLVISALLMLPLDNYEIWRLIHVISSYGTVVLLVLKFVMHWEMIAKILQRVFSPDQETLSLEQANRRRFLRGFSVTAVASLVAVSEIKEWLNKTASLGGAVESSNEFVNENDGILESMDVPTLEPTSASELANTSDLLEDPTSSPTLEPTKAPTITQTPEPTLVPTPTATGVIATGVVKCIEGCSYPGKCGRYRDKNKNSLCDLGEPIW